jgi:hypothetical protein
MVAIVCFFYSLQSVGAEASMDGMYYCEEKVASGIARSVAVSLVAENLR